MVTSHDEEDAWQEAHLRMLQAKQKGCVVENERKFLTTCKRNYVRDLFKKKKTEFLAGEITHKDSGVSSTLDKMTGRFPLLLHMRYIEGLPARKIAERLGIKPHCVHSDLSRAKHFFREIYEQI